MKMISTLEIFQTNGLEMLMIILSFLPISKPLSSEVTSALPLPPRRKMEIYSLNKRSKPKNLMKK